jgi:hypothetical protein
MKPIYIIILISLIIIGIIILYNMNSIIQLQNIEHFESKLKYFKKNNKKNNKFGNIAKKKNNNKKKKEKFNNTESKINADSLINRVSKIEASKVSLDYVKNEISKYNKSFNKEKFINTGNPTQDAIAHYKFFKDKFFDIFK